MVLYFIVFDNQAVFSLVELINCDIVNENKTTNFNTLCLQSYVTKIKGAVSSFAYWKN